jgi:hypothetical protein
MISIRWCVFVVITGVACASPDVPTPTQESAPTPVNGGSRTEELARRLEEKLASAQRDLAEQEQRVERAKKEAKFYECKARNERLRSEVARHEAQCMNELATQAQCAAEVERGKGDSTLLGCFAGFAIAAASGGSAIPWALGGCGAGRGAGELAAKECPVPQCAAQDARAEVFAAEGLKSLPLCGGRLGVALQDRLLTMTDGPVLTDPGLLARAGLQSGDFLAFLDQIRVRGPDDLRDLLDARMGREIEVRFVREHRLYVGRTVLPNRRFAIDVRLSPGQSVSHYYGTQVAQVFPGSPLASHAPEGRPIVKFDGRDVVHSEHLRDMIRYRRAGETVAVELGRSPTGAEPVTVDVVLAEAKSQ